MDETASIIEVIKKCYDAYLAGDSQRLLSYMAPDIEWETPEVPGIPFSGKRKGHEQVSEFFQMVAAAQQLLEFRPGEYIAQGHRVVVLGHYEWTVRATGANWSSDWVHIFTVRFGQVTAFREMLETHRAAEAYRRDQAGSGQSVPVGGGTAPQSIH